MEKIYEFIKKCGTYYLATVDGDQARVRPFGTIDLFEGKLYIQTGKGKDVFKQANGAKVELCCFDGEKWLRLAGTLVDDDNVAANFKDAKATFSSFTAAPETIEF